MSKRKMGVDPEVLVRLADFFDPADLEWRALTITKDKSKALAAAYVTARGVAQRLDDVLGPENWKNEYAPGPQGGIICGISICIATADSGTEIDADGRAKVSENTWREWVIKWDGAENTDVESVKGGLSNSFRRAAVQWGIGRYLYFLPEQWVPYDDQRRRLSQEPRLPKEFLPMKAPISAPANRLQESTYDADSRVAQAQPADSPANDMAADREFIAKVAWPKGVAKGHDPKDLKAMFAKKFGKAKPTQQAVLNWVESLPLVPSTDAEAIQHLEQKFGPLERVS